MNPQKKITMKNILCLKPLWLFIACLLLSTNSFAIDTDGDGFADDGILLSDTFESLPSGWYLSEGIVRSYSTTNPLCLVFATTKSDRKIRFKAGYAATKLSFPASVMNFRVYDGPSSVVKFAMYSNKVTVPSATTIQQGQTVTWAAEGVTVTGLATPIYLYMQVEVNLNTATHFCWQPSSIDGQISLDDVEITTPIDTDDDNDAILDVSDNCPLNANAGQLNTDGDAFGDICDHYPLDILEWSDADLDGLPDNWEVAHERNPAVADYAISLGDFTATTKTISGTDNLACIHPYVIWPFSVTKKFTIMDSHTIQVYTTANPPACAEMSNTRSVNYVTKGTIAYVTYNPASVQFSFDRVCALTEYGAECFGGASVSGVFDSDSDGVTGTSDAFPLNASESVDTDNDGVGNNADTDDDSDGVPDTSDAFPLDATESVDTDNDGTGDNTDTDDDNDAIFDVSDNCPLNANADQLNTDADSQGDVCDTDDDNDDVADASDKFPLNAAASSDIDNDGFPGSWNASCDSTCQINSGLTLDNCPSVSNVNQLNTDADSQGDACDTDDDNDGVLDIYDAYSLDNSQAGDIDSDGVDGVIDNCPGVTNSDQLNTDADSQGDACDTDDDNDGVPDASDAFPNDACASVDTDNDGAPDSLSACVVVFQEGFETGISGPWINNGWGVISGGAHTGSKYAYPDIYHGGIETLQVDLTLSQPATVSFYYYLSLKPATSSSKFYIDATSWTPPQTCQGCWQLRSQALTAGTHTLRWEGDPYFFSVFGMTDVYDAFAIDDIAVTLTTTLVKDAFPNDATESVDTDGDGKGNNSDNCPLVVNANQTNMDGDSDGDVCDTDIDGDGVVNASDAFPLDATESVDTDSDGVGDNSDAFPNDATESVDTDSDGVGNNGDNCPSNSNASQIDTDNDGTGDTCDNTPNGDTDSDGADNLTDNCPAVSNASQTDTDGNGLGDACDANTNGNNNGAGKGGHAGTAIALGDMNNDGYADLVIGAPLADVVDMNNALLKDAGTITILSGSDGSVINVFDGTVAKQHFGSAIAVIPDKNSDGIPDLVVGEPLADTLFLGKLQKDAGNVSLYSGADGSFLSQIGYSNVPGDHFGAALAVGDFNGDGTADIIIGAPFADTALLRDVGQVYVIDGVTGEDAVRTGSQAGEHFGAAVAVDITQDRLIVGSPAYDILLPVKKTDAGRVQIFDDINGLSAAVATVPGVMKGDKFGSAVASFGQDMDGDTFNDWAVGIPGADILDIATGKTLKDIGKVQFFSGTNTTALTPEFEGAAAGDNFGAALSTSGDINNDGINDIAVGSPRFDVNVNSVISKDAGRVEVINSAGLF